MKLAECASASPRSSTPSARTAVYSREVPLFCVLAAAAALFLLLGALGAVTDWWRGDESYTWNIIQQPPRQIIQWTANDVHPPLYYLLLAAWNRIWPQPAAMKAFSLLAGLAALLAAAWAGWLLRGRRTAILIALLWATFPMFLHYSQDARMYSLALFFETLAIAGWALAVRRPRLGWLVLTAALTASLYTQNLCLIFAAALIGCELLRSLAIHYRQRIDSTPHTPGPKWILSSAFIVGVLYFPWALVLRRQMQADTIAHYFQAPTGSEIALKYFLYPYTLATDFTHSPWLWLPGILLLGIIPLISLLACFRKSDQSFPAWRHRPMAVVIGAGLGAFVFLVLYSWLVKPIFEINRHGVLFIPFLLFPVADWLAQHASRLKGRLAALLIIAFTGILSVGALHKSRDQDLSEIRNVLLERAPSSQPILFFPSIFKYSRLMWDPLPLFQPALFAQSPDALTSCTLVFFPGSGPLREEIKSQAKSIVSRAASSQELFLSYDAMILYLNRIPARDLVSLFNYEVGFGMENITQQAGHWNPAITWSPSELSHFLTGQSQLLSFTPLNPQWIGLKLNSPNACLTLSPTPRAAADFSVYMLGGYRIPDSKAEPFRVRLNQGASYATDCEGGRFLIERLCPSTPATTNLTFDIPPNLARRHFVPSGDAPPGIYLTWGGWHPLKPEEFKRPGFDGLFFDVGSVGDELFLRGGYYESEGLPPSEVRWTKKTFEAEVPVWPGRECQEVVLFGLMNQAVRDRRIVLTADPGDPKQEMNTDTVLPKTNYGEYSLKLPRPLAPGIHHLVFKVGTWSPKEAGTGGDTRQLGFFLDGVGLRK